MTIPIELQDVLAAQPEIISGVVRLKGSRVPVQALIDTLDSGESIEDFLDGWHDVTRERAGAVIHWEQNHAHQAFGLDLAG